MLKNGLAAADQNRTLLVLTNAWKTFVRNGNSIVQCMPKDCRYNMYIGQDRKYNIISRVQVVLLLLLVLQLNGMLSIS